MCKENLSPVNLSLNAGVCAPDVWIAVDFRLILQPVTQSRFINESQFQTSSQN